jgi:very-short-patch-repair endonuclease
LPVGEAPRTRLVDNLPVTLIERTLFDLAAILPAPRTGRCIDEALRIGLTSLARLEKEQEALAGKGRKGSGLFSNLLALRDDRDGMLESVLEEEMLKVLRDRRLPFAVPQHEVFAGGRRYRLDFAWPFRRLGVEAHSFKYHSGLDEWKKDWARDNALKLVGWTVLHYTWDDIHFEKERVVTEILQALTLPPTLSLPISIP